MGKRLDQALAEAEEIEAAEATARADAPIPRHVKVSKPNRTRPRVLQIRLSEAEYAALEQVARRRDLPVSAVAREQLLPLVLPQQSRELSILAASTQLIEVATFLRESVAAGGPDASERVTRSTGSAEGSTPRK